MKQLLAGFPIDVAEKDGIVRIRFFPKSSTAKYPDNPVLILRLDSVEKEKLLKIIS